MILEQTAALRSGLPSRHLASAQSLLAHYHHHIVYTTVVSATQYSITMYLPDAIRLLPIILLAVFYLAAAFPKKAIFTLDMSSLSSTAPPESHALTTLPSKLSRATTFRNKKGLGLCNTRGFDVFLVVMLNPKLGMNATSNNDTTPTTVTTPTPTHSSTKILPSATVTSTTASTFEHNPTKWPPWLNQAAWALVCYDFFAAVLVLWMWFHGFVLGIWDRRSIARVGRRDGAPLWGQRNGEARLDILVRGALVEDEMRRLGMV